MYAENGHLTIHTLRRPFVDGIVRNWFNRLQQRQLDDVVCVVLTYAIANDVLRTMMGGIVVVRCKCLDGTHV